jgi:lipopolysaccharide transport system ATP-binding protein
MHSSDDVLIRVEGVSKRFCRDLKRSLWYGIEDTVADCVGLKGGNPKLRRDEFWAVNDVSFELRRGECLGLIGHNGAGKTTLLKMLNGLIKPDKGSISMRGRVGGLIALGAGFNPILTGRENIYINGSVLGLTKKEIDAKIGEIIDFAEIGEFIDAPVQSYSSGMAVRLGFAVATAMEPDILLLDEVLAVGDAAFRAKCYERIGRLMKSIAVIFVSHAPSQISRICNSTLLMRAGKPSALLPVAEGLNQYANAGTDELSLGKPTLHNSIARAHLHAEIRELGNKQPFSFFVDLETNSEVSIGLAIGNFVSAEGQPVAEFKLNMQAAAVVQLGTRLRLEFTVPDLPFVSGRYYMNFALYDDSHKTPLLNITRACSILMESNTHSYYPCWLQADVRHVRSAAASWTQKADEDRVVSA